MLDLLRVVFLFLVMQSTSGFFPGSGDYDLGNTKPRCDLRAGNVCYWVSVEPSFNVDLDQAIEICMNDESEIALITKPDVIATMAAFLRSQTSSRHPMLQVWAEIDASTHDSRSVDSHDGLAYTGMPTTTRIFLQVENHESNVEGLVTAPASKKTNGTICQHTAPLCPDGEKADQNVLVTEGSVRLVGGATKNEGRVEVFHDGCWGTICDDGWDLEDAGVVCRMLGYDRAIRAPKNARYGKGVGDIWIARANCWGTEESISDCSFAYDYEGIVYDYDWGQHDCVHEEDASVVCV